MGSLSQGNVLLLVLYGWLVAEDRHSHWIPTLCVITSVLALGGKLVNAPPACFANTTKTPRCMEQIPGVLRNGKAAAYNILCICTLLSRFATTMLWSCLKS